MYLSACIEWLFKDSAPDFADRIHAAKNAGLSAVEFHLWDDKPIDAIRAALDETGVKLTSFCVGPRRSLVDPGGLARFDDLVGQQIGLGGGRRADMDGFIGHQHMRRAGVGIGIDRDGLDAHLLGRPHDTARNFATVRDQDFRYHSDFPQFLKVSQAANIQTKTPAAA